MNHSIHKKLVFGTLPCVLSLSLAIAVPDARSYLQERSQYVEVGGDRLAYVPRTARFVKIDGEVRRIVKFADKVSAQGADCLCPNCCDGQCLRAVLTDGILGVGAALVAAYIWVKCD